MKSLISTGSWRWYVNRLRCMSIPEVTYRNQQVFRKILDKNKQQEYNSEGAQKKFQAYWHRNVSDKTSLREYLKEHLRLRFAQDLSLRKSILCIFKTEYPDAVTTISSEAEKIIQGKLDIFELKGIDCGSPISWHQEPVTKKLWPFIYAGDIDIRRADVVGDPAYTWRFNRCQHFVTLAKAYYLTGNSKYSMALAFQLNSWIDANPFLTGVNWTSAMELSIRCIAWIWALNLAIDAEEFTDELLWKTLTSIDAQMRLVEKRLSLYSSANNHLIGELAGLYIIGTLLGELPRSDYWRKLAEMKLIKELERQIHSDGVNAEQALHYHSFVLDFIFHIIVVAERNNRNLASIFYERGEKMCEFMFYLMDEMGNVPAIGDSDDGYAFLLKEGKCNNYKAQLAIGSILFERTDFKSMANSFPEKAFWLLGIKGYEKFRLFPLGNSKKQSKSFLEGGYFILRDQENANERILIFDCGPLGYPSTAAHGHADALSIYISAGGTPLLIDPGTYTYIRYPEWRSFFKGSSAHNTVVVDGIDQSVSGGAHIWGRKAKSRLNCWYSSNNYDFVDGQHDGYLKSSGIVHRRWVLFVKPNYWIMEDTFSSKEQRKYETLFHFTAGKIELNESSQNLCAAFYHETSRQGLIVIKLGDPSGLHQVTEGSNDPIQGWISSEYGLKKPAPVIKFINENRGIHKTQYFLAPFDNSLSKKASFPKIKTLSPEDGYSYSAAQAYKISNTWGSEFFFFSDSQSKWLKFSGIKAKSRMMCVRLTPSGKIWSLFTPNPEFLSVESEEIICSDSEQVPWEIILTNDVITTNKSKDPKVIHLPKNLEVD